MIKGSDIFWAEVNGTKLVPLIDQKKFEWWARFSDCQTLRVRILGRNSLIHAHVYLEFAGFPVGTFEGSGMIPPQ